MKSFRTTLIAGIILIGLALVSFIQKAEKAPSSYIVVYGTSSKDLSNRVNTQLTYGYSCVGGVSVHVGQQQLTEFYQAMQK